MVFCCFFIFMHFVSSIIHFLMLFTNVIIINRKWVLYLLITNEDILKTIGNKIKRARLSKKYTQDYVSEKIDISTDLLRNIENGRNIGSVPTLLNLCNFLKITPNYLFSELLTFEEKTLDTDLKIYINELPNEAKDIIKNIINHFNQNY